MVRPVGGAIRRYQPAPVPDDQRQLQAFLREQLEQIAASVNALADGQLDVTTVAPAKPRDGMRRYADGTNWNPGFGEGEYVYFAGVWNYVGESSLTLASVSTITATTVVTATSGTILVDTTAGNVTVTLPANGTTYTIKRITAGANTLTVATASGLIDNAATASIAAQYESITVKRDGTDYWII